MLDILCFLGLVILFPLCVTLSIDYYNWKKVMKDSKDEK